MGVLDAEDLPIMIVGATNYIHAVREHRKEYVLELLILAVAQYLYAVYCTQIPGDSKHVRSTPRLICRVIPFQYRRSVQRVIEARNAIAHYMGTGRYITAIANIEYDLEIVLNWCF